MKNKRFIIGGFIILIAAVFLGYLGFRNSLTYYYEVGELKAQGNSAYGKTVRVGGEVEGVQRDVSRLELRFNLIDIRNRETVLAVIYHGGSVPDIFGEGRHVIIEGKYTAGGVFEASSIMTKCSSKYIPATSDNK